MESIGFGAGHGSGSGSGDFDMSGYGAGYGAGHGSGFGSGFGYGYGAYLYSIYRTVSSTGTSLQANAYGDGRLQPSGSVHRGNRNQTSDLPLVDSSKF